MPLIKFIDKEVGKKIKEIRESKKWSQEKFGKILGSYSQDTVSGWEKGRVPHAMILKQIADIGVKSVDWLLGRPLSMIAAKNTVGHVRDESTTPFVSESRTEYPANENTPALSKSGGRRADQEIVSALRRTEEVLEQLRKAMANDLADKNALANTVVSDKAPLGARPVEIYELSIAAGGGALVDTEARGESMWFRRDWLDRHGLDPTQCSVFSVRGESMEETLPDGCSILVDRNQTRRRVGHIYVVRTEDGLIVKRLRKDEDGDWLLVSDHPSWKPLPWSHTAEVIGEVKWMAKTL